MASSQAVYNEGAFLCPEHGHFYGATRPIARLKPGDFRVQCPLAARRRLRADDERAPMGGENIYAISKATRNGC